jgi:LysM domain-containing protein
MTERGLPTVDGAPACPFVALEDDRDARAPSPDRRHRCYAEPVPAPRALAHQEAYCLSSSFPVCPTFQDWARREAATPRDAEPVPAAASEPPDLPPRRNRPREWTAPPSWVEDSHDRPVEGRDPDAGAALLGERERAAQGLAGSAADRMAGGEDREGAGATPPGRAWASELARDDDREDHAAGWGPAAEATIDEYDDETPPPESSDDRRPARVQRSSGFGLPIGDRRPRVGQARPRRPATEANGPAWERPRRYEAYPSLKTRVGLPAVSMPPLVLAAAAVVIAALALFFLPALLGVGSPGGQTGASPAASGSSSPSVSTAPTPSPAPTQQVYVVAAGDTLSRIASRFGLTVEQVLAANPEITNPNRIAVGDEIVIPDAEAAAPSVIEDASPSPS